MAISAISSQIKRLEEKFKKKMLIRNIYRLTNNDNLEGG